MSVIALYPGTFDPPTNGHVDLIQRGAKLFEHLTVGILNNPGKNPLFTVEERVEMLRESTSALDNVSVATFDGLMVDFARHPGHLRLRARVSDGADEPPPGPGDRDRLSAAGRALLIYQLADVERSVQLWRRRYRTGSTQRAQTAARANQHELGESPIKSFFCGRHSLTGTAGDIPNEFPQVTAKPFCGNFAFQFTRSAVCIE